MNNHNSSTEYCLQGTVTRHQVECKEMPFFVNSNGDIAYREPYNIIFEQTNGRRHNNTMYEMCKALNIAYKYGYEMDRVEYK